MGEEAVEAAPEQQPGSDPAATEGEPQPSSEEAGEPWDVVGEDSPNAWDGMREGIQLLGEGKLAPEPETEPAEGPEAEGEAQPEGEAEPTAEGEPGEQPEAEAESQGPEHYTALTEDGEPAEVELPDGVQIQFKADGEEHSAESVEELVQLAQKGVAFDRKSQEFSETTRQLENQLHEIEEAAEQQRAKANRIIKQILTDEEAYAHYAEQLEKLEDPEYQELVQKARKGEKAEEEAEKREQRQREEAIEAFQESVSEGIQESLDDFDLLRPSDEGLIQQHFFALQEQAYQQYVERYQEQAETLGLDEEEVQARAYADSLQVLTEDNLRKVMEALNQEIQSRVGENGRKGSPESGPEDEGNRGEGPEAAKREVESQNRYTDEKLEQKKRGPGVRGGGAAPGGGGGLSLDVEREEGENAFQARMRRMKETLAEAREG